MNTMKIRYFVEVARCGSFSEAARRLYTAQPNLSKQIAGTGVCPVCPLPPLGQAD